MDRITLDTLERSLQDPVDRKYFNGLKISRALLKEHVARLREVSGACFANRQGSGSARIILTKLATGDYAVTKLFVPLAIVVLGTTAAAQEQVPSSPPGQKPPAVEVWSQRPGVGSAKRTGTLTVRVTRVDSENRMLGVEDAQGRMQVIKVGDSVHRLNEIAPGDIITAKYEQKLTLEYQPDGAAPVERSATPIATRGADSAPSGTLGTQVRATVTVVNADPLFRVVTLRDDNGEKYQVKAGPDIDLAKIKAGQRFLATYTETVAVKVEKSGATMFAPSNR